MMNNEMTAKQVEAVLVQATEQENKCIELSSAIRAALVKFDGKPISKRMQTAVQAVFPEATVFYKVDTFFCTISIWGGTTGRKMDNRFTVYFGGYQATIFTLAGYDESNASCGSAAIARNAGRARVLARPELLQSVAKAASAVKQANSALTAALGNLEAAADMVFSVSDIETVVHSFCGGV